MQDIITKKRAENLYFSIFKESEFSEIFSIHEEMNSFYGAGITITSKSSLSDKSVIFYIRGVNNGKPEPIIKFFNFKCPTDMNYIFKQTHFYQLHELITFFFETGHRYTYFKDIDIKKEFGISDFFSKPIANECYSIQSLIAHINYNPSLYLKTKDQIIKGMSVVSDLKLTIHNDSIIPVVSLRLPITSKHKYCFNLNLHEFSNNDWTHKFNEYKKNIISSFDTDLNKLLVKQLNYRHSDVEKMSFDERITSLKLIEMLTI